VKVSPLAKEFFLLVGQTANSVHKHHQSRLDSTDYHTKTALTPASTPAFISTNPFALTNDPFSTTLTIWKTLAIVGYPSAIPFMVKVTPF